MASENGKVKDIFEEMSRGNPGEEGRYGIF